MAYMKKSSAKSTLSTPIEVQYIERLYKEWGCAMAVNEQSANSATILCRTPFSLGLLVGHIMNRWLRDGQGLDKLVIDTKACKATITVRKDASKNRLKVLWR